MCIQAYLLFVLYVQKGVAICSKNSSEVEYKSGGCGDTLLSSQSVTFFASYHLNSCVNTAVHDEDGSSNGDKCPSRKVILDSEVDYILDFFWFIYVFSLHNNFLFCNTVIYIKWGKAFMLSEAVVAN